MRKRLSRGQPVRLIAPIVAMAVAASMALGIAGCGCPAALLSGELVADGQELAVATGPDTLTRVQWPFGYGVRADGDTLVLTNLLGGIEAREGDHVKLGGGMVTDDRFGVCGQLNVRPAT